VDGGETWVAKSEGLESPYIYEIAIDPNNTDHILVSAYEHGINQSLDGGETWAPVNHHMPEPAVVYSIDFDPTNSSIVYAAVREPTRVSSSGVKIYPGGVYKSTDNGKNWIKKSNGLPEDYIYDLAIDPNNPDVIYTAQHRTGVYKTINGGESWDNKTNNMIDQDVRSVYVTPDSSRVYIGFWDGYGFSYSNNGGDTWVSVSSTNRANLYVYEVQADPNHPSTVYLSTHSGVHRCENPSSSSSCTLLDYKDILVFDLELDVNNPAHSTGRTEIMYVGLQHYTVHRSNDLGASFDDSYEGIRANIVNSMLVNPTDPSTQYMSVYGRGVFKSDDNGITWYPLYNGLTSRFINQIAFRPGNDDVIYAAAQNGGVYWSEDAGLSWFSANIGLNRSDKQESFSEEYSGDFDNPTVYGWMDPVDIEALRIDEEEQGGTRGTSLPDCTTISFDPNDVSKMVVGTGDNGLKLSNDFGKTWTSSYSTSKPIYDSLADTYASPYLFFIGLKDEGVRYAKADRSDWRLRNEGMHDSADVYALANAGGGVYYAGTESGIYKTTNAGASWVSCNLVGITVNDILVDLSGTIWAATGEGLYRSTDAGGSWMEYTPGQFFNKSMISLAQIPDSTDIYVGTDGGNMYRITP
jgi:photosystem II stability/assembly factor-like uncharacterized protein